MYTRHLARKQFEGIWMLLSWFFVMGVLQIRFALAFKCPDNCSCVVKDIAHDQLVDRSASLSINCNTSADNETLFVDDLDRYLVSLGLTNVTELLVSGSPLSRITPTMCKLSCLETLSLDGNRLNSLPVGCFTNMTKLSVLSASDNSITCLRSNSFANLINLQSLDLSHNHIELIDPDVFVDGGSELELISLNYIDLSKNQMRIMDSWPFVFSQKAPHEVSINLDGNYMSQNDTTNYWNFTYACGMPPPAIDLSLKHNLFDHLAELIIRLGLTTERDALCLFANRAKIDITYNPLICDCLDIRLYVYFKIFATRSASLSTVQCTAPPNMAGQRIITIQLTDFVCSLDYLCPTGCICHQRPIDLTIIINCENNPDKVEFLPNLLPSPKSVPYLSDAPYSYELLYKGNGLTEVDKTARFLNETDIADFRNNRIVNVTLEAFEALENVEILYLHNNELSRIDSEVSKIAFKNLKPQGLGLHHNAWICDCHNLWLKHWLVNITDKVLNTEGILCSKPPRWKGSNLLQLADDKFICGDPLNSWIYYVIIIVFSTMGGTLLLIIIPSSLVYKFRVSIYAKTKWHPFDKDECEGEGKIYDVFVSYSDEDEDWVMVLVARLEERGFIACIHKRVFPGGRPILANIGYAITGSKRTICILSDNYLRSNMCVWEFTEAFNIDVEERRHRLFVVKLGELCPGLLKDTVIQNYIRTFSYVEHNSKYFLEKLLYSLPLPGKLGGQLIAFNSDGENADTQDNGTEIFSNNDQVPTVIQHNGDDDDRTLLMYK